MPSRCRQDPAHIDLTIERVPVGRVRYDPANTRRHNPANLNAIEASLRKFGQRKPLVVDQDYVTVAGNGTLSVIVDRLGWEYVVVSVFPGTAAEARAYGIADNQTGDLSDFDEELLGAALGQFPTDLLAATGFDADRVAELLAIAAQPVPDLPAERGTGGGYELGPPPSYTEPDELPEHAEQVVTRPGDVWLLGPHRLGCGDSTDPATVKGLLDGVVPVMLHADPPYGMGKEAVGILNDNQYGERLDRFHMSWWTAWRDGLAANGSVYIWGRPADLWRLWYVGGLCADGDLVYRNEIVWDKGVTRGLRDPDYHMYPLVTERCLFLMRGPQFLGSQNKDDYWEGYEPMRSWLEEQLLLTGWTRRDIDQLTGTTNMYQHWFTQSQFSPIPESHYTTLQRAAGGVAFRLPYDEVFQVLLNQASVVQFQQHRREQLTADRSFFDNTHEVMADVWRFPLVPGEERFGHATPKPVAMAERAILSSSRDGDAVGVPFAGTGPEFIAGHRLGRRVFGLELQPQYCDTILRRYQQHTRLLPVLAATGEEHDFLT